MEVQDIDHKGYDAFKVAKYMLDMQEKSDRFYAFECELKDFLFLGNEKTGSMIDYELRLYSDDECKWYDHEEDMILLSQEFPNVLFKLHGEGEENGDIWDKYFMDGKMQYCPAKVQCAPFDRSKLE